MNRNMKDKWIFRGEVYLMEDTFVNKEKNSVQKGRRPIVVVSNNAGNRYGNTLIVAPVSSRIKTPLPTHMKIKLHRDSVIMCEQLVTIPKSSLVHKLSELNKEQMRKLNRKLLIGVGIVDDWDENDKE